MRIKTLIIAALASSLLASCGPTSNPSIEEPTSEPSVSTPTTEEPTVEKTVEFAPMHLYQDLPTLKIRPLFSVPEMAEEEHFTYTLDDERIATIEGNVVTYLSPGRGIVTCKSENFETKFVLFTHEGFSTVGGPLANPYQNIKNLYDDHYAKENATVFIGDSFFQFWRDGTANTLFSKEFRGKNAVNLGINGTTTHHWRAMWEDYLKDTLVAPKNIVLNIGINNVDDNSEDGKNAGKNVRMLIEDMHETFPNTNIYYFSVTRCSKGVFATYWDRHDGVNTYLKENFFLNNSYATYLDANELFGEDYADYRMPDGLHLNARGYMIFKSLITENVEIEDL